jgi:selenoprotein W-related protein
MANPEKPVVAIAYCTQCNWLLRAAWMAQELLQTFPEELGAVSLVPGTGGVFQIHVGAALVWDRRTDGGFPDVRTRQGRGRDRVNPDRALGHLARPKG